MKEMVFIIFSLYFRPLLQMADTHTNTPTHTQNGSHKSYVAPEHIKCVQSELVLSVKYTLDF